MHFLKWRVSIFTKNNNPVQGQATLSYFYVTSCRSATQAQNAFNQYFTAELEIDFCADLPLKRQQLGRQQLLKTFLQKASARPKRIKKIYRWCNQEIFFSSDAWFLGIQLMQIGKYTEELTIQGLG